MNSQALPHWVETQRSEISNVACNNCGARIAEREDLPIKYRKPCPDCGSTSRKFFASVHFTANVEAKAALSVVPEVNLLLQTLIVHGERISDGQLIEAVDFLGSKSSSGLRLILLSLSRFRLERGRN